MPVQAATLHVFVQPLGEPRPLFDQRLVHELDRPVVGDEQPSLDQRREHARDPLVVVGVELVACCAPARDRFTAAAVDEPEQNPARHLLLIVAERGEGGLGMASDGASNASRALVGGERERVVFAFAPEVEQRRREERKAAGLAGDIVDERVHERRLDLETRALGRPFDRAAELTAAHRPEQDVARADEVRKLEVRGEVAEEISAQGDHDQGTAFGIPGRLDQRADERTSLVLGDR
jgi:hypothetical protein